MAYDLSMAITVINPRPGMTQAANPSGSFKEFWDIDYSELTKTRQAMQVQMSTFFNASHQVMLPDGKLGNLHEHSFHIQLNARLDSNGQQDISTPFEYLKGILAKLASIYEAKHLNHLPAFQDMSPTLENIAAVIEIQLKSVTRNLPLNIRSITVYESPTVGITINFDELNHANNNQRNGHQPE
jgi:6-pyruvoyl-tetrahydropterin synthase